MSRFLIPAILCFCSSVSAFPPENPPGGADPNLEFLKREIQITESRIKVLENNYSAINSILESHRDALAEINESIQFFLTVNGNDPNQWTQEQLDEYNRLLENKFTRQTRILELTSDLLAVQNMINALRTYLSWLYSELEKY